MQNNTPLKAEHLRRKFSRREVVGEIQSSIAHSNYLMDAEKFSDWLALTHSTFTYGIYAFSPEIQGEVVLMEKDRAGLKLLFDQLTMHERYLDKFRRIVGGTFLGGIWDNGCSAVTAISVYHTNVVGVSALFCVGTYEDTYVVTEESRFALAARKVTLDTRRLPFGSHIPM